jgi:hypothetical protein
MASFLCMGNRWEPQGGNTRSQRERKTPMRSRRESLHILAVSF